MLMTCAVTASQRDTQTCNMCINIMKTFPCNIQRFFSAVKIENFTGKISIFFLHVFFFFFFAQNIDCGYMLEPLWRFSAVCRAEKSFKTSGPVH